MSYQVLARKYRPRNFDTLVGQEHVVRALTHALEHKRLHHAYLFTGTRGVGKTTLSRILAKALNCIGADGAGDITASPCGVCEACIAIDAGRFVDYIEMDAASNRGVDEMTQLLEQAVYAPSNARFKVYMIDEVHMLSNQAFNSMLKTLEEPPEHVKFILATTDPQKIPVTVLSRCLQFNLKQMPPGHIVSHLENILGQEQITFEVPALRLLAQGAQGSTGATGPPGPSDERFKKNIQPITNSIEKVSKIRGVRYFWKDSSLIDSSLVDTEDIGFIAQELNQVLPEVVFGSDETYYSVKYSDIIALCIEAIKEQSVLLDIKEEKLLQLENKAKEKGLI